jgi:hypothetical protein
MMPKIGHFYKKMETKDKFRIIRVEEIKVSENFISVKTKQIYTNYEDPYICGILIGLDMNVKDWDYEEMKKEDIMVEVL